jgi:hypothetical protein
MKVKQYLAQVAVYGLFAFGVATFADGPSYQYFDKNQALLKISLAHGGEPIRPCRRLTREERLALPANMRKSHDCPHQRVPLRLQVLLDDDVIYDAELPPTGLRDDGPSKVYQRFTIAPGTYRIIARLRDRRGAAGFDHESTRRVTFRAGQSLSLDFKATQGGFVYE